MQYKLVISLNAQRNTKRIVEYIKYTLLNSKAAEDFIVSLEKKYEKILNNPYIFSSEWIGGIQYRKAMVKRYIIIYRIDEQTHIVRIIAIGYSLQKRRNIIKHK